MKRGISTSDPEIRHEGKVKKEVGEKIGKFLKRGVSKQKAKGQNMKERLENQRGWKREEFFKGWGYIKDGHAGPPLGVTGGGAWTA